MHISTYIIIGAIQIKERSDFMHTMNDMEIGDTARVVQLNIDGSMRRRLLDIGLIEGTRIECLQKSPLGDPAAYLIRGAVIAIRSEDSRKVCICT